MIAPLETLRRSFAAGRTRPARWRLRQLAALRAMLVDRESDLLEALRADLGKSPTEAWVSEIGFLIHEIDYARKRLHCWVKPDRVRTPLATQPGRSMVVREPLGVVLIIAPWNYPIQLALGPLTSAIAAGNCAVVKPSETAQHSSGAIARWLPEYLDAECFAVVEGGVSETTALLAERFDSIFFTGNETVGRIVMEAAARHLTPVTLELGGKSPCIVDRDVDLPVAARRIVWGKFLNAGQTCVAPDYVLVHEEREEELLAAMVACLRQFYGDDPRKSPDYGRIINRRHHDRLSRLLGDGEMVAGGEHDVAALYLAPTILKNVPPDAPVMQEEIFGPVLPVLRAPSIDEAMAFVNGRPKPLALYVFSKDRRVQRRVVDQTSSGGVAVNEVVMHLIVPGLPFGGVGLSGTGACHGRHGFETFSHRKAILTRSTRFDLSLRYPPYDSRRLKWLRRLF